MLKSLLKGVSMGTGMGIGQELTGTLIQHFTGRGQGQGQTAPAVNQPMVRDIQCGRCNEINTGDSRFCGACGNMLVQKCTLTSGTTCGCGFVNATGQKFCSECGSSLAGRS
ncbi:MAG: zinc ribbon domain-containing protein [Clostridiales bacterium]|jgi:membrane protease subunit (stomatin/prohibitin family)|nr:zinc ribbon domain-containing protein [Clostridiales bacterium]